MLVYQIGEVIPLGALLLKANGTPDTGKTVTVSVYDVTSGLYPLQNVVTTEAQSGLYRYSWNSGYTTVKTLIFVFKSGTTVIVSGYIRITDVVKKITDTVDLADGRAI